MDDAFTEPSAQESRGEAGVEAGREVGDIRLGGYVLIPGTWFSTRFCAICTHPTQR